MSWIRHLKTFVFSGGEKLWNRSKKRIGKQLPRRNESNSINCLRWREAIDRGEHRDEREWTKLEEEFDRYVAMKNEEVRKQTREETEILTRTATRAEDEKEFADRINAAVGMLREKVKRGITLKDIDEFEKILSNMRVAN